MSEIVRTADLFAGMGGIRLGFEQACAEFGLESECVFESEIKSHAVRVLKANHPNGEVFGDVTKIDASTIPDFDFLLAGFPCQAFSTAGLRRGFEDARGTLFFEVARILKEKSPYGFVLENVEGLVVHDRKNATDEIGSTLTTMLAILTELGYLWSWKVVDASTLGVPQRRRRLYLVGTKDRKPNLEGLPRRESKVGDVLETGLPSSEIPFAKLLLSKFPSSFLAGKSVKDKRLGPNNLNAWDVESKGPLTDAEKRLMRSIATERRKKKWAKEYGIDWMDGMPLTEAMIRSFWDGTEDVSDMLDDLTKKGYLSRKRPKRKTADGRRETDENLPLGYDVVSGKLSYPISTILDPNGTAPTLTATDMDRTFVPDGDGIRRITLREGLRLFGYPENFAFPVSEREGFDLLGNTVVVPAIREVSKRVLDVWNERGEAFRI